MKITLPRLSLITGAISGAIGWQVLRAAGWNNIKYGFAQSVINNAFGAAIITLMSYISRCISSSNADDLSQNRQQSSGDNRRKISKKMTWTVVNGALSGALGSAIAGYLDENQQIGIEQIGFATAAGATGSVIFVIGFNMLTNCCYLCIGEAIFSYRVGPSGVLPLVQAPNEDLDHNDSPLLASIPNENSDQNLTQSPALVPNEDSFFINRP